MDRRVGNCISEEVMLNLREEIWSKIGPKAEGTTQNGSKARKDSKARKKVYSRKAGRSARE